MAWRENTNLYLNSNLIDPDYTKTDVENEKGGWINRRQIIWFNIDFRVLLGDLYNKYDNFCMSYIFGDMRAPAGGNTISGPAQFWIEGLDFLNGTYDQTTQNNSSRALLRFHANMGAAGQVYNADKDAFILSFRKPRQMVRLTFYHTSPTTGQIYPSTGTYPTAIMQFNVCPCAKPSVFAHALNSVSANLSLSTNKISSDYSNPQVSNLVGSWGKLTAAGTARQTFSFNVNMRNVLGDMWNKYERFAIFLVNIFIRPEITLTGTPYPLIYMRGLNFRNTFIHSSNVPTGYVPLLFYPISASGGYSSSVDRETRCFPFVKSEAFVQLSFDIYNYITTLPYEDAGGIALPHFSFDFLIMPIS